MELDYKVDLVGPVHDGHNIGLGLVCDLGHPLGLVAVVHAHLGIVHVEGLGWAGLHAQIFFFLLATFF